MASTSNHHNSLADRGKLFPLKSISDVVKFFRCELENGNEPDLTFLSIIAGYIENNLTSGSANDLVNAASSTTSVSSTNSNISATANTSNSIHNNNNNNNNNNTNNNKTPAQQHPSSTATTSSSSLSSTSQSTSTGVQGTNNTSGSSHSSNEGLGKFPIVTYEIVESLYKKFQTILSCIDKPKSGRNANRQIIKKVSDVIWHSLIRSTYKDRAHLQNLYTYLSANKLDCFGVAFAVVAGCQILGYKDVHLAISEDHAWVVFGKNMNESVEVTWHGKGHEDKRGQDISAGVESRSWLYLSGYPVKCDRYMEVAAIVSAINISLTLTSDCSELAELQQNLLWLLYDMGHLQRYPMGLGTLGELEEVSPTEGRPSCETLYKEAIQSAQAHYRNHHVYPYTYQGGYYYRQCNYREAFASWANAGDVIRLYNYSRDDEEIYKEFLEIANELIPHVMKTESSGHSAKSILRDSECFANLLRFYDGICQWEEGSLTPILHIGWAKPLVNTISKFDYDIRSQVIINCENDEDDPMMGNNNIAVTRKSESNEAKKSKEINMIEETVNKDMNHKIEQQVQITDEGNNNCIKKEDLLSKISENASLMGKKSEIPSLADLTAACGEKILNPEFLLQGGGQPFAEQKQKLQFTEDEDDPTADEVAEIVNKLNPDSVDKNLENLDNENISISSLSTSMFDVKCEERENSLAVMDMILKENEDDDVFDYQPKRPVIKLYSQKMKGLKDLLLAEKLNTHAISLQVTAQSQVAGKKIRGDKSHSSGSSSGHHHHSTSTENEMNISTRPKRTRRE